MSNEDIEDQIAQVEPYRWKPLELFHTVYPDDPDMDKLDPLFPGRAGTIYKNEDGSINRIVISRVWPHDLSDEDETGLYSSDE